MAFIIIIKLKYLKASNHFGFSAAVPDLNNELYRVSCHMQTESIRIYRMAQKPLDITVAKIRSVK